MTRCGKLQHLWLDCDPDTCDSGQRQLSLCGFAFVVLVFFSPGSVPLKGTFLRSFEAKRLARVEGIRGETDFLSNTADTSWRCVGQEAFFHTGVLLGCLSLTRGSPSVLPPECSLLSSLGTLLWVHPCMPGSGDLWTSENRNPRNSCSCLWTDKNHVYYPRSQRVSFRFLVSFQKDIKFYLCSNC